MPVEKLFQCRRNRRIKHIVVGEICSYLNQSRCHELANRHCYLNFFDPERSELKICYLLSLLFEGLG